MKPLPPAVVELLRRQHQVASRSMLKELGLADHEIRARLSAGEWTRPHRGVYQVATSPHGYEQRIAAAWLAAGQTSIVSHESAAWLWGFLLRPPQRLTLTVPRGSTTRLAGVQVHRCSATERVATVRRQGLVCTDQFRTLVDLAAVAATPTLDYAVDRALASKCVSVAAIEAQLDRVQYKHARGTGALRQALARRGFVGAPHPSVLESRLLRLLARGGVAVMGTEVAVLEGLYRIDVMVTPWFALEVDGYLYHWSPEHKRADERRRNEIRMNGVVLLVYCWRDVVDDGEQILAEVRAVLSSGPRSVSSFLKG